MSDKRLIIALDVASIDEAKALIEVLGENISVYKVGSQLFTQAGPEIIRHLTANKKDVFLDLKFHDIPNTVAKAISSVVRLNAENDSEHGIMMCTLHIQGGEEMCQRAAEAAIKTSEKYKVTRPQLVGITVLTSDSKHDNISEIVSQRAQIAKDSGLDGIVASSQEASLVREKFGEDFIIVTPGIRPAGSDQGDQKRITTPSEAIQNGSNFLVVGRPIVQADNPSEAASKILQEISGIS